MASIRLDFYRNQLLVLRVKARTVNNLAALAEGFFLVQRCNVIRDRTCRSAYSRGSILMIAAPRLLPTQNVGWLVELSTFTRRMLVVRGSK